MYKIICYCKNISETEIKDAIKSGANTLKEIQANTKACTGKDCATLNPSEKCCADEIMVLLSDNKPSDKDTCSCCGN